MASRQPSDSQLIAQLTSHQQKLNGPGLNGTTEAARADLAEALLRGLDLAEFTRLADALEPTEQEPPATEEAPLVWVLPSTSDEQLQGLLALDLQQLREQGKPASRRDAVQRRLEAAAQRDLPIEHLHELVVFLAEPPKRRRTKPTTSGEGHSLPLPPMARETDPGEGHSLPLPSMARETDPGEGCSHALAQLGQTERHSLPEAPAKAIDWAMARQHLELLGFKPDSPVVITFFPPKKTGQKAEHRFYLAGLPESYGSTSLEGMERWLASHPNYSLGVVIGHGGKTRAAEITAVGAIPWEDDSGTSSADKVEQWSKTDLPRPSFQLDTGGKSIHHWYRLAEPCSPLAYKTTQREISKHARAKLGSAADVDSGLHDPCQVMRLAGGFHPSGRRTVLLNINDGRFTIPELRRLAGADLDAHTIPTTSKGQASELVIPNLEHGIEPPPPEKRQMAPEWDTGDARNAFEKAQVDYDAKHAPTGMHWRDAATRNVELLRRYAADALRFTVERGLPDSGTYDHAFGLLASLVNGVGSDIAVVIADSVGWSQNRGDFSLPMKAQSIIDNPPACGKTLQWLFESAEVNGWPRPWVLDIRDRRRDQTADIPKLVDGLTLESKSSKVVVSLQKGLAAIDKITSPAQRLAAQQELTRSLGKSGAEMAQLLEAIEAGGEEGGERTYKTTLEELLARESNIRPAIHGLLARGCVTVVASEGGLAKTSLCYRMAAAIATGTKFAGMLQAERGAVLIVQKDESDANAKQKAMRMDLDKLPADHEEIAFYFDCWHPGMFPELAQWIDEVKPAAVFMDSLGTLFGGGGKSLNESEVALYLYRLNRLAAQKDVAIVLTHHLKKAQQQAKKKGDDADEKRKRVRLGDLYGNSYIVNAVTDVWGLVLDGGTSDEPVFALEVLKPRSNITQKGDLFHLQGNLDDLSFAFQTFNYSEKAEELTGTTKDKVLQVLKGRSPETALSVGEMQSLGCGTEAAVQRAVRQLYSDRATTAVDRVAVKVAGGTKPSYAYFRTR